jgi:hypothetical protein
MREMALIHRSIYRMLAEAESMRQDELEAQEKLCDTYGFSRSHLDLLNEFYHDKADANCQWYDPSSTFWKTEWDSWHRKVTSVLAQLQTLNWTSLVHGFRAVTATDASEQRYLKVLPGEEMTFEIIFSHKRGDNAWICQFQIGIDIMLPADISQLGGTEMNRQLQFSLSAPEKPGLYMLWHRGDLQYNFKDAANNRPKNYLQCENWYSDFIAWFVLSLLCYVSSLY